MSVQPFTIGKLKHNATVYVSEADGFPHYYKLSTDSDANKSHMHMSTPHSGEVHNLLCLIISYHIRKNNFTSLCTVVLLLLLLIGIYL